MTSRIGPDLQRARTRREIGLEEVEAATRIRARFLEAIEAEDWEALPGGVYTRGFIRTYASFLGLDGERLAQDFRRDVEGSEPGSVPARELAPVAASRATGTPGGGRSRSFARWLAIPAVLLVGAAVIVAMPGGAGDGGRSGAPAGASRPYPAGSRVQPRPVPKQSGIEVRLAASAEVWVCLLDARGRALIEGKILEAGARAGPFRSGSFTFSLGNGEVSMTIDGKQAQIPPSSSPVGYAIEPSGELAELGETERPTCT